MDRSWFRAWCFALLICGVAACVYEGFLRARHYFEQLSLADTSRELCRHGFNQQDLIFRPATRRFDLVNRDHPAKFAVYREWILNL